MATGKRYYWIKLKESFMTSDTVDFLMSQKDGANYVVLYQMLCLKTINTGGRLSRTIGEIMIQYDVDKIQRDCKWFSADTIRVALNLYKRFGLIYEELDGTLVLADHENMVGSETDWASQKRKQTEMQRLDPGKQTYSALESGTCVESGVENLHTDIRDKSSDIRYQISEKEKEKENKGKTVRAEPDTGSTPPPVISLPLIDGTDFGITQADIDEYASLYPAVDILQELRGMVGWLKSNPKRKKTRGGVRRFINNWLSEEQNRGGILRRQPQQQQSKAPAARKADTRPAVQGNPFAEYLEDEQQ